MVQFLIHEPGDTVAVAVVDIKAGDLVKGIVLETRMPVEVKARMDIPLGHKIALRDAAPGDTVMKYGNDIGKVVAAYRTGDHVHVHNVKTKRW